MLWCALLMLWFVWMRSRSMNSFCWVFFRAFSCVTWWRFPVNPSREWVCAVQLVCLRACGACLFEIVRPRGWGEWVAVEKKEDKMEFLIFWPSFCDGAAVAILLCKSCTRLLCLSAAGLLAGWSNIAFKSQLADTLGSWLTRFYILLHEFEREKG